MSRRKRTLLAVGLMVVVAATSALGWTSWSAMRPGIHPAAVSRIRHGMREADVSTILGGPRSYTESDGEKAEAGEEFLAIQLQAMRLISETAVKQKEAGVDPLLADACKVWIAEEGAVLVGFDTQWRVVLVEYRSFRPPAWTRIRDLLARCFGFGD